MKTAALVFYKHKAVVGFTFVFKVLVLPICVHMVKKCGKKLWNVKWTHYTNWASSRPPALLSIAYSMVRRSGKKPATNTFDVLLIVGSL